MKNVKNGWSEFLKLEGSGLVEILFLSFVIRLGLEPKTPTLKVLCSTC